MFQSLTKQNNIPSCLPWKFLLSSHANSGPHILVFPKRSQTSNFMYIVKINATALIPSVQGIYWKTKISYSLIRIRTCA